MQKLLSALLIGMLAASCAPSTPQARIQREPQKFDALSPEHRALVEQGQIARGMDTDAVFLAWGRPSRVFQGSRENRMTERWDYAGSRPVYSSSFYGGFGRGFGPYRCGGLGPEVTFIPYRIASVWFIDSRVDSWERIR